MWKGLFSSMDELSKRLVRAMFAICGSNFVLLVCFIVSFLIYYNFLSIVKSDRWVIPSDKTDEEVLIEVYGDRIRVYIHQPDSPSLWATVLVYDETSSDNDYVRSTHMKYNDPHFTWLTTNNLEISISDVDKIFYKRDDVDNKKIIFHIGHISCQKMSNMGFLYAFRGVIWRYL